MSARKSDASGRQGERAVEAMLLLCAYARLGTLQRRPTPTMVVRGQVRRTKKQGTDFFGQLAGGRAIYLEVKRMPDETRLAYSELRASQRGELETAFRDGAVAAVVVLWGPLAMRTSVVPWAAIRDGVRAGKPGSAELEPWRLPPGTLLLNAKGVVG